jgi:tetratricopeptide (TPR) repeat protein
MALSADELIEKSKDQRRRKRHEESLVSALAAVEAEAGNANAWWQVSLSRIALGDERNAIPALRKTVELSPETNRAWWRLGELLLRAGERDEAKEAFTEALDGDTENTEALEGIAKIYGGEDDRGQDEDEASVLERIERLSYLSSHQKNRFGILHHRNGRLHEAIKYWRQAVVAATGPASRFNLGLAYSHADISQGADAIDMWRLTLRSWPDYERAPKSIRSLLPRLLELANKARRQGESLLPREQWYEQYMNPFELLNPPEDLDFDDFDPKTLQKLKKLLLQEIDLEEGAVSWIPGVTVDKSRAIGLCDELNDETKCEFHWQVFQNKPLLAFLTTGSHEHFLVGEPELHMNIIETQLEMIELIEEEDNGFQEWLGRLFAPQFDRVLSKAIDIGNLVVLECLLGGRRWVSASHADQCFQNARRVVDRLVQPLRDAKERADQEKPSLSHIEGILHRGAMLGVMNLLPCFFEDYQNQVVHLIREIAISCFNTHDDIDLSRQIIELAKRFRFRSAEANRFIEKDVEAIEKQKLVRQEPQHEAKIIRGTQNWEITNEGIWMRALFIPTTEIASMRWGRIIAGERSDFLIAATADDGRRIIFQWEKSNAVEQQQQYFQNFVEAAMNYLLPSLVERAEKCFSSGSSLMIGPCQITRYGIRYPVKRWIFTVHHFVSWQQARVSVDNGEVIVVDANDPKKKVLFSLRDTDNAPLLRVLVNMKNGRDN